MLYTSALREVSLKPETCPRESASILMKMEIENGSYGLA
jgi:hypothetical protein